MAKPRMTNEHKTWVRDTLVNSMKKFFRASEEDAVEAVTGGSVPMYVDVCRRIVKNNPFYAEHHRMETPDDWFTETAKAWGEWILYKAGVRKETPEAVPENAPNTETKEADDAVPST